MEPFQTGSTVICSEEECLESVKALIQENEDLYDFTCFLDDKFLLNFVRGKKLDYVEAYNTLVNYFQVRIRKYPDLFKSMRPSTTLSLNQGIIRKLASNDEFNRPIFVNRTWMWDPKEICIDDTTKMFLMCVDEAMNLEEVEDNGVVAIFDMAGYSMQHAKVCTPSQVYTLVSLLWKSVPLSYKALHIVNEIFLLRILIKTVKPFLPKKLQQRLYTHSNDLASLHEHISPSILPKSLGGHLSEETAFDDEFDQRIRDKEEHYEKFAEKL